MARQNKETFLLRHDFFPQIKMLAMEQRGRLLTAIYAHATEEELPEMDELTTLCFGFIRASLDANAKKYYAECEQNRENGRKGGRPKKRTVSKKTARFFRKAAVFLQNRQETAKTLLNLYLILILNLILSLFLNLKRAKKRERNFSRFSFSGISETLQTKSTGSLITTRLPDGCARERRS